MSKTINFAALKVKDIEGNEVSITADFAKQLGNHLYNLCRTFEDEAFARSIWQGEDVTPTPEQWATIEVACEQMGVIWPVRKLIREGQVEG